MINNMILKINTNEPYGVMIEKGLINKIGPIVANLATKGTKVMIVSDSNVFPIFGERVMKSIESSGLIAKRFIFEAGEQSKTLFTVRNIYSALTKHMFTRSDLIIALGGGVAGDMAGFAAATYLRGISFIQIPTSLLAQIDSSVGGKTGVDLPEGKNLVGAFHQPKLVICDPDVLKTLPKEFLIDGLGEVVKYACIDDVSLFEQLESGEALANIEKTIYRCIDIKRKFVEEDVDEKGNRILLNFGHTFGHAIEKLHDYSGISHGCAVAIGMVIACEVGENLGYTEKGTAQRVINLLTKLRLPVSDINSIDKIIDATALDKKSVGKMIKFIFIPRIGEAVVKKEERNYLILKYKIMIEQQNRLSKS